MQAIAPYVAALAALAAAILASGHAVLYKRDPRSAIGWVGLIWLVPFAGAFFYVALGINRIRRRAQALGRQRLRQLAALEALRRSGQEAASALGAPHMAQLVRYVDKVLHHPLLAGNRVDLLVNGDEAFPAMLRAIGEAQHSIAMATYIFDTDRAGRQFVEALGAAVERGVQVRVLVDDVGARYSRPSVTRLLSRRGVPNGRFLRTTIPWRFRYVNLRSHRKVLVIDGRLGFTGGMNVREGNLLRLQPPPRRPIQDVHARFEGPVVAHFQEVFLEDWAFATGEVLGGEAWFPALAPGGEVMARGITDGPDENFEKIRLTLLGAVTVAAERIRVMTPYFLPDAGLVAALGVAAMRGIQVDIVLPVRGNLRLVHWASQAILWQVLERGCRIWLQPGPFAHTKLMTIDGVWTLMGSSNWDPRSYRLNFELDVECYDRDLTGRADAFIDGVLARSRQTSLAEVDARSLWVRLRDGSARLLAPYL
jgi:cardiolipin synthase A/B